MPRGSRSLTIPLSTRRPEDTPPAPAELYTEPEHDIELLGEMLHDNRTMGELLAQLPFDRVHYRANLRIVAGAALRMRDRCARLLEDSPIERVEDAIDRLAERIVEEVDRDPSNIIDDHAGQSNIIDDHAGQLEVHREALEVKPAPKRRGRRRKTEVTTTPPANGVDPQLSGKLLARIAKLPSTSDELARSSGGQHKDVYVALADLRSEGRIRSERVDGRMVNVIA